MMNIVLNCLKDGSIGYGSRNFLSKCSRNTSVKVPDLFSVGGASSYQNQRALSTASFSTETSQPKLKIPSSASEGYRRLLKAQKKLFAGDTYAQEQGRKEIRSHFIQNRNEKDSAALQAMFQGIAEAEDMLLFGIMQGKLNETSGNFEVKVKPEHTVPDPQPNASSGTTKTGADGIRITSTKGNSD